MTFLCALAAVEVEVEDAVDALHVHRQPFEPVGQLARDRRAFEARDLLEVGELRHLHAVAPAFPAQPPGAERRRFPVVLDEADVVELGIDADGVERLEIEVLDVVGRRLQDHLELVVVLQAVGVLAVAAVLRPARGLHIGRVPRLRPERAQAWSRDGRCRRRPPCRRAAGSRSRSPPNSAAAPGSIPGTSAPGACGREDRCSWVPEGAMQAGERRSARIRPDIG